MATEPEQKQLDCRGLSCPQPVIRAKEALDAMGPGRLQVLVDNEAARLNVARFAQSQGLAVDTREEEGGVFRLAIDKDTAGPTADTRPEEYSCCPAGGGVIGIIAADTMGRDDIELGRLLMRAFVKTLPSLTTPPGALYFYNSGVRITAGPPDQGLVEPLRELESGGVAIYSCGTCLDYFGLTEQLQVGEVTNMYEIIQAQVHAQSIIRP